MTPSGGPAFPVNCPEHPKAQIRHSWTRRSVRLIGVVDPSFDRDSDHKYECSECGRRLMDEKAYQAMLAERSRREGRSDE